MSRRKAIAALGALLLSGCFQTTLRSGHPPGEAPPGYDRRWHSGWVVGALETGGPHDLARVCPEGWAQIETTTDPSQALVTLLTIGIYAPQSVTVICRVPAPPARAAPPPPKPF